MSLEQINRRRTFAIISHPDAGKTTLTEKFLLYGGALHLAGSVTARKNQRASTSDWMELERQRGISVSSTVLQFEYNGYQINLLDTPGHKDFSEDTYRVLTAVDAVVMVIDAGKGIESQTQKLFEICRRRRIPIFTFMNKLDRPALDPLALMDELERVLGLPATAVNWPLGNGRDFRGVFDRQANQLHLFERTPGGAYRAPVAVKSLSDPAMRSSLPPALYQQFMDELDMLQGAGHPFDLEQVRRGELIPVFFGSAMNNFGVQLLLDSFLRQANPPQPRHSGDRIIPLESPAFSGFIFKIQANMDPRHRDRIAFLRVCAGKFSRDMTVTHVQSGKKVRLASSHKLFGRERETVDEAWPGDVIGLVGHGEFGIGDTLSEDPAIVYREVPRFTPECFGFLHSSSSSQFKRFREGLGQLLQEGVMGALTVPAAPTGTPLLSAVGPLQFEVAQYRLKSEYAAESRFERARWQILRWIAPEVPMDAVQEAIANSSIAMALNDRGHRALLFADSFAPRYFSREHPKVILSDTPYELTAV